MTTQQREQKAEHTDLIHRWGCSDITAQQIDRLEELDALAQTANTMTPDPLTPSPPTPRIYTKCPACGNDTLTVNDDKHLLCTWVSCPDPTLIDRVREENATLVEEMKGWRQTILDEFAALVKEREELRNALDEYGRALERIANHLGFIGTAPELAGAIENKLEHLALKL